MTTTLMPRRIAMPKLQISFVVPAYNEQELIGRCLRSIVNECDANQVDYDLIVVDNNSTDLTAAIALLYHCRVIPEYEKGVTRARQTGFKHALHDVVAFIDADNMLPKGWLPYALTALDQPNVVAASGPVVYYDLSRFKRITTSAFYTCAALSHKFFPMLQGGNFILKKSALLEAGGFNTDLDFFGEDTDTAMRLTRVGKVIFSFNMFIYSSGRRLSNEGLVKTGFRYIANYFSMWILNRPVTNSYNDIRD